MIRRASALTAVLAALTLPAAAALAQDYEEIPQSLERGMYVQFSGIVAFEDFDSGALGKNSGGLSLHIGLRSATWSAVEVQFEWASGMEPDGNTGGDDWTTTFNFRIYPFKDMLMEGRLQPYGLAGVGASSFKRNLPRENRCTPATAPPAGCETRRDFGFASRWGGGMDFYLTDRIVATLDASYVWVAGSQVKDLDYASIGIGAMYRFY